MTAPDDLLVARGLSKRFGGRRRRSSHLAVDAVDLTVRRGQTLAVVGESGAGKSTTGRMVLRLIEPDAGTVHFDGIDVLALGKNDLRLIRRRMQMIFQDPFSSLDPRCTIGESLREPLKVHFHLDGDEEHERVHGLIERVGLGPHHLDRYPAELSGGQLQRIAIARALTLEPELIVCDEPVAALDVSIRAQVLNLLDELQTDLGIALLFISHDLGLVEVIADDIAVMRGGRLVEVGPTDQVFGAPAEDYTKELLAAIPRVARHRAAEASGH